MYLLFGCFLNLRTKDAFSKKEKEKMEITQVIWYL